MATHAVNVVVKARDDASRKFRRIGSSVKRLSGVLKGAVAGMAVYFGARQIFRFGRDIIDLYGKQELAVKHVTDALNLLGKGGDEAVESMKTFAREIQAVTTFGDEAVLEMAAMGASMGKLAGDDLKKATIAAIGLSKAYGVDTVAAMRLVARAAVGDTATLTRYGIKLGEGLDAQEKFNKVLEIGATNFELAKGETDTFSGAVAQLQNAWGDAKEKLGSYIAGSENFRKVIKFTQNLIQNFGDYMAIAWAKYKLTWVELFEGTRHLFTVQIPQLLKWLLANWKDTFTTLWSGTKAIFVNMGKNIADFFKGFWSWLKGEGFDFKWTGLLDGFESTLQELPKIAKRELSSVEKNLNAQINDLNQNIADKILAGQKTAGLGSLAGGEIKVTTAAKAGADQKLAARQSRFLAFAPGSYQDPAQATKKNTSKLVALMTESVDLLRKVAEPGGGAAVAVTNIT